MRLINKVIAVGTLLGLVVSSEGGGLPKNVVSKYNGSFGHYNVRITDYSYRQESPKILREIILESRDPNIRPFKIVGLDFNNDGDYGVLKVYTDSKSPNLATCSKDLEGVIEPNNQKCLQELDEAIDALNSAYAKTIPRDEIFPFSSARRQK